ncbi:hypothetical protein F6V25_08155 [Oryzomonas japonica]|uniref:Uncharacterized protein n=1 Tax=Oryzomonas japonica TaxID=2603858 RepID=A0A7J4ZR75_9BACT|nr:hypothetical protein [Oryzomonas japonica]KAB0665684.1 hypothetical protein F6V25_08155 [Oryzomonas japonica]
MEAKNELLDYLNRLLSATVDKSMEWFKANPTTYMWTTNTPKPGKVIIQRVNKRAFVIVMGRRVPREITKHLLQVLDGKGNIVFSVDGMSNSTAEEVLIKVYEAILSRETEKGFEFFKDIIPQK